MKKLIILLVAFVNLNMVFAQDWQTDFSKAKEIATEENKRKEGYTKEFIHCKNRTFYSNN